MGTPVQPSSRNPFRDHLLTPTPTGTSTTSSAPSYHSALPASHIALTPTPTGMSSVSGAPSYYTASAADPHSDDEEESPEALPGLALRSSPARTGPPVQPPPSAPPSLPPRSDSYARPPASPPSLPPRPGPSPLSLAPPEPAPPEIVLPPSPPSDSVLDAPPPAYSITPDFGGGETVVELGPRRPFQRAPEPFIQHPPPQQGPYGPPQFAPPSIPPPRRVGPAPERPLSQVSDFSREFYASGGEGRPTEQPRQPRYAPPPGAPPPGRRPRAASTSSGAGSTAPPASDGRPTTTPTPGHPLLRNGQTLVYPDNYSCPKCNNTGYKNFDPSHPCRKCWERFSKPFTSILASSPWSGNSAESQSQHGRSYQRPLPAFKPPQAQPQRPPPGPYVSPPASPGLQRSNTRALAIPFGATAPAGATVVMPGDPRIGGRLCWRCGGRGMTPFLIFDEMPCETCGGIGRLLS
ncbi:hypothetical protein BC834DRAFT_396225 [Gloeopeniophorella convolvens]|nr:hypothetical protein BC834DRAFT_396225 [Gloeopeniophorella convolvens]